MKLKKLNLDNFDSQLDTYSLKAIRQQLNCLAANVNRLVDSVNDISEQAEEPSKDKPTKPELVHCRDCCFYGCSIKSNYDQLGHWCNKNGGWYTDDYYCGDGVSKKIFNEREDTEEKEETSPELKPCPFCGGEAELAYIGTYKDINMYPYIKCKSCEAMTASLVERGEHAVEKAIDKWNTRYEDKKHMECQKCCHYDSTKTSVYRPKAHWCRFHKGWFEDDFCCKYYAVNWMKEMEKTE